MAAFIPEDALSVQCQSMAVLKLRTHLFIRVDELSGQTFVVRLVMRASQV